MQVTCEASPHHLTMTDEDVRSLDTRRKMNPPLRGEEDRQALIEGLRDGIDRLHRDGPRAARPRREGGPLRAGADGHDRAGDGVRGGLHRPRAAGHRSASQLVVEKLTSGLGLLDLFVPAIAAGEPANLVLVDLDAEWVVGESGYESRSENCCFADRTLRGRVLLTVAAGAVAYRERSTILSQVTPAGGGSVR